MRFRKATQNMETLYPNVTEQEMLEMNDKTCIICREDMEFRGISTIPIEPVDGEAVPPPAPAPIPTPPRTGPNDTPKKLPCGHVFHYHCLRSWLERQQSCHTWFVSFCSSFRPILTLFISSQSSISPVGRSHSHSSAYAASSPRRWTRSSGYRSFAPSSN
jgi:hypothetical protein